MTNTVDSTAHIDVSKSLDGSSEHSVANPYIKDLTGDGLLILKVYDMH